VPSRWRASLGADWLAPNGRPWGLRRLRLWHMRGVRGTAALGRTTLKSCPPTSTSRATQAQLQAAEDALTGLATFRVLRERLSSEVARSDRTGQPFAVLFVDLDNFKQVNDQFGHEAGNECAAGGARVWVAVCATPPGGALRRGRVT